VHAVVEVNVGRAGAIPLDKRPRTGTNETVTRFVTNRVVSFGLNDNTSAAIPIQSAADKVARTSHWITLKKNCANDFTAHRVRLPRILALGSTPAIRPDTQLADRCETPE